MTPAAHPLLDLSRVWSSVVAGWRKVRTFVLAAALVAALAALALLSWRFYEIRRDNATIAALADGEDIPVDARTAAPEVVLARSAFLLARDRREDAQALLDAASGMADAKQRAHLLYNHANARIRDAIAAVQRGDQDRAIPLTRLGKDEYRAALRLDPRAWNAKYNFDVAMRMVRDFPGYETEGEEVPPEAAKKLWTDLPGVPKGLP